MGKPNIKMIRIDERLIHGQGQLWIKSLGVNLVICANDQVANDPIQQTLMKTVVSKEVGIRFWSIERTAEVIWKASPSQTIFVIIANPTDALRLCKLNFPIEELNIGNIHAAEGKKKVSQFIYLGKKDQEILKELREKYNVTFNTKTSPISNDGTQSFEVLNSLLN
ncbi:PTS sugar transporter subunit IIB [Enterococcus faecium]|uniref:PTS sugar transporter subunit IIB n=1 Tax=Enterococcus faecium TaxID=1352 RepID=UPI0019E2FD4D|nr:PTS sugar transporter subunit IIB [Enterococcus faecium]EGP5213203.1 PTS mannose/fructose/sorbose transporter subunit IIB [Enterococcus faecium]EME8213631.1 PTS sugar transporter subunit IIB [Enterococcus faecium]MDN3079572.1 PTS sugar transporter subunit IIB [Enterococcus faecium]MDQ8230896.1 PTS sugar transporter subunit IIB [Enterococcus faecium]MDQ8233288.1 PTS sugar transporter subunit IIB [Enterococcus faecium]